MRAVTEPANCPRKSSDLGLAAPYDGCVTRGPSGDRAAAALVRLRESCRLRDLRSEWPEEQVRRAVAAGASLEQAAAALGLDEAEAWERLTRSLRAALRRNAIVNADLSDAEALELAVAETKAARQERGEASRQRSGPSVGGRAQLSARTPTSVAALPERGTGA